jgi:hypothetical protein
MPYYRLESREALSDYRSSILFYTLYKLLPKSIHMKRLIERIVLRIDRHRDYGTGKQHMKTTPSFPCLLSNN